VGIALVALVAWLAIQATIAANNDDVAGPDVLTVALTALACLPLAAHRRAPLGVFVLTGLAASVLNGVTEGAGPPIGPTLALYWMVAASDGSRERTRTLAAAVIAVLMLHLGAAAIAEDGFPGVSLLFGLVVWGSAWLAGDRTRLRRERVEELEERARRAEREVERERRLATAEERTRIARDLHDSAGHAINVILVHAGLGRLRSGDDPEGARESFETIEQVARETVGEIDELVGVLRDDGARSPEVEPPLGLGALETLVERHRAAGMDVSAEVRGEWRPLPQAVDQAAYRIL
jgi:signal transduction histidine kinase